MYLSAAVYLEEALSEQASWGGVGSELRRFLPVYARYCNYPEATLE